MTIRTLVLSPRYTTDSRALRVAALQAGWNVERLGNWRVPEHLRGREVALYGEPLFVEVIAAGLSLAMLDVPCEWLPQLPLRHRHRSIELTTLGEARNLTQPTFVKPADGRKSFEGKVYASGAALPSSEALPDETRVFTAEPVIWDIEFAALCLSARS